MSGRHLLIFILSFCSCSAVIHHLNESEYARMPALYALDAWGACLVPRAGTYCVLRLDLYSRANSSLMRMIHEYSENTLKHFNHTYIQRGVCVTDTCKHHIKNHSLYTTEGLTEILRVCLNESMYTNYGIEAKLTHVYYCEKKGDQIEKDIWDWAAMSLFIAIVVINIAATLYDFIMNTNGTKINGNPYILCFSLRQNWKRLFSPEPEEVRTKRLEGLHGAKLLTLFLMFIAHVIFFNSMAFNDNVRDYENFYDNVYYQMILNGLVIVQIFFVISGFLLVYNLEVYCEKRNISWALAVKLFVVRFLRLTPSYAVMIIFMSTWLRHLGAGPLWRYFVADSVVADCRQYWWTHLLYINNYLPKEHICALHTWHIAADTQLFIIGLVVYLATRARGRVLALAVLVALGVILPALHVWLRNLDPLVLMSPETYRTLTNDTFYFLHLYGHNNLASYATGMAVGILVHRMQKKGVSLADNKVCKFLSFLVVPAMMAILYSGSIFYIDDWQSPLLLKMVYAALHRFSVGLVTAFVVVVMALRINSYIRWVFEHRVWVVPSRLSYSVYLLHLFLIHALMGVQQRLGYVSTTYMTVLHFGILLLTFMISLPFSLMVEAPFLRLTKVSKSSDESESKI